mgnify:CR=1 FL=1
MAEIKQWNINPPPPQKIPWLVVAAETYQTPSPVYIKLVVLNDSICKRPLIQSYIRRLLN